jgi:hypothetical protein
MTEPIYQADKTGIRENFPFVVFPSHANSPTADGELARSRSD